MLTSFQIEIFLGFFLTAKLHDLNHTLRNHPLLNPLQTHEGLSEAKHLPCEPTEVAVKKKAVKFSANYLLKRLRKSMLKLVGVLTWSLYTFLLAYQVAPSMSIQTSSQNPTHFNMDFLSRFKN
jgi:hypothetical protein